MSEKIVKGLRLSNSEDSFILSGKNDSLVEELMNTVSSLREELDTLKTNFNELSERVDKINYDDIDDNPNKSSNND